MSQATISRIELAHTVPTIADVEALLAALDAPPDVVATVLALAKVATTDYTSARTYAERGLWQAQTEISRLISTSTTVKQFLPAIPSGLLQTEAYARHVLTSVVPGDVARDIDRAVTARMALQAQLADTARQYVFLLPEHALTWRRAPRAVMADELAHMAVLSRRSNVDIAIIRHDTEVSATPLNLFSLYDDRLVTIELTSGEVFLRDPRDISYHHNLFDFLLSHAVRGDEATGILHTLAGSFYTTG